MLNPLSLLNIPEDTKYLVCHLAEKIQNFNQIIFHAISTISGQYFKFPPLPSWLIINLHNHDWFQNL